jgi:acetyl esterase/lipase
LLALIIASLEDESLRVSNTAYELLLKQPNPSQELQVTIENYQKLPPIVYIPGGSFLMSAPKTVFAREDDRCYFKEIDRAIQIQKT